MMTSPLMLAIFSAALSPILANGSAREQPSADALKAFTQGARIEISLCVVDSTGKPVEGAMVNMGLSQKESGKFKSHAGETDTNGNWRVEANCSNLIHVRVMKEGYYETRIKRHLFSVNYADVNSRIKGRRWLPWYQTVVLKEKRKPMPMVSTAYLAGVPVAGVPLGYDLKEGDWVPPYGSGKIADVEITYNRVVTTNVLRRYTMTLSLVFPNPNDGCTLAKKDSFSGFDTPYEAELPKERRFDSILDGTDDKILEDKKIEADELLMFRVRTKVDDKGKIVECYYGYIDGPLKFAQGPKQRLRLTSIFNPRSLDRNLEWDGKGMTVKER